MGIFRKSIKTFIIFRFSSLLILFLVFSILINVKLIFVI